MTFIVLVTSGKNSHSADFATVRLFSNLGAAKLFCDMETTGRQKHWIKAEIVNDGSEEELNCPED